MAATVRAGCERHRAHNHTGLEGLYHHRRAAAGFPVRVFRPDHGHCGAARVRPEFAESGHGAGRRGVSEPGRAAQPRRECGRGASGSGSTLGAVSRGESEDARFGSRAGGARRQPAGRNGVERAHGGAGAVRRSVAGAVDCVRQCGEPAAFASLGTQAGDRGTHGSGRHARRAGAAAADGEPDSGAAGRSAGRTVEFVGNAGAGVSGAGDAATGCGDPRRRRGAAVHAGDFRIRRLRLRTDAGAAGLASGRQHRCCVRKGAAPPAGGGTMRCAICWWCRRWDSRRCC